MLCILNVGRTVPTLCILNVGTVPMLCLLNVGTVPTLCILNVGTVPTFSHSLSEQVLAKELNQVLQNPNRELKYKILY